MAGTQQSASPRAAPQPLLGSHPDPTVGCPTLEAPTAQEKDWNQLLGSLLPALLPSDRKVTLQLQELPCLAGSPARSTLGTGSWAVGSTWWLQQATLPCHRVLELFIAPARLCKGSQNTADSRWKLYLHSLEYIKQYFLISIVSRMSVLQLKLQKTWGKLG